ncbi:peroxisome assembly factor 2 [Aplysia californica]|uniref:Peroxisomal ATPase PEX6 n=1 Tax=Aplysia californica TaxID=6500 RepID=A0ABM0JXD5_APLCA|nr:peroxisome assembly factor 2 [Aplysia californica]
MAASTKKGIGKFRRSYAARLIVLKEFERRINPLHLLISTNDAPMLKKTNDDNTFVCAIRVKRDAPFSLNSNVNSVVSSPSGSSPSSSADSRSSVKPAVSASIVSSEDIIVCVSAKDVSPFQEESPKDSWNSSHSLSIDDDSSDDDLNSDPEPLIKLYCTELFTSHYDVNASNVLYIRGIEVFPLTKAVFSVSDEDAYEWVRQDKFSAGLLKEICNHDLLIRQNDALLAPFPELFLADDNFHPSWFFSVKAIACAPFQMGLITATTEIIIYFEKAITRLPSDHRHLSGSHLDQYVDLHSSKLLMSDFCRSMSGESSDDQGIFGKESDVSFNNFFLSSALVIQQGIHWSKILLQNEDSAILDLTSVLGMPKKLLRQYGILNGTIVKIALYPRDLLGENTVEDAQKFLKQEKPIQKYVKVQCLTKKLDESDNVFISSILLFNLQKGPPIVKSPLLIIEKPYNPLSNSGSNIDFKQKLSRSVSTSVPFATEVHITIISSPSYTPKANHVESLNKYFQIPRLLSIGDVFAVSSADDPEFWQESKVDTGVRKPVIFFKVSNMVPRQPDVFAYYVDVNNSMLKQVGSDHSYVPLNANKYLSARDAVYGQSIVCPGLEKYVIMLETLVLPHLHRKYDGTNLIELSPSVLLTGPRGCGKKTVINTVARKLYAHVMEVNCHDLSGDSAGASESRIKSLFLAASKYSPCIVLMRNIEVVGKERDGTTEDPRTISAFSRCILQLASELHTHPLVVIATSNSQSSLSEDMVPCFLHEVNIETPTEKERGEIIQGLLESYAVSPDLSISHLAQRTAGFVLGDLIALVLQAKRHNYQRLLSICRPDGSPASLQLEEDIVTAGVVLEQKDLEAALDNLQSAHSDSIGAPKIPSVKWSDIGGLADVKSEILDTIQLPLQHPELLAAGLRRSGVLLYGPPGTGKTLLAKAVATECSLNFLSVKGPELINMYVGQSEENVREVFKRARSASPCVIFFDELDSLAPNRGRSGDSGGVMDRVVSQLLAELDGLHQSYDVFIIGATNRPDLLDPALLRPGRFDKLLYLGVSGDSSAQLNILQALTRKFDMAPDLNLNSVADECPPNLTGADLYALCADALLNAMRTKIERLEAGSKEDESRLVVSQEDFLAALKTLVPSVSLEELQKYEQIRHSFQQ